MTSLSSIRDFPPFYTPQPNADTRARQLALWADVVLLWARTHREYTASPALPVFANDAIRRRAKPLLIEAVLQEMAKRGQILRLADSKQYLLWHAVDDWARILAQHIDGSGARGTVLTVYELANAEGQEFAGMPEDLLLHILKAMERRRQCVLIPGAGTGDTGVKFA